MDEEIYFPFRVIFIIRQNTEILYSGCLMTSNKVEVLEILCRKL